MSQTEAFPVNKAVWELDDETDEVVDLTCNTDWSKTDTAP